MIIEHKHDPFSRFYQADQSGVTQYTDGKYVYVPILKNAHTWLTQIFRDGLEWEPVEDVKEVSHCKKIIVLRDPLERWVSAMATYLDFVEGLVQIDNSVLQLLCDGVFYDQHTLPQTLSLQGIDTEHCVFFYMTKNNSDFDTNIKRFISEKFKDIDYSLFSKNDGNNKPKHKYYKEQFSRLLARLDGNVFHRKLYYAYLSDYRLLETLKLEKEKYKECYENFNC